MKIDTNNKSALTGHPMIAAAIFLVSCCTVSVRAAGTLDFLTQGWTPDGALTQTYTGLGTEPVNISIAFTGSTGEFVRTSPKINTPTVGADANDILFINTDFDSLADQVTATINFSQPVKNPSFLIRDLDRLASGNQWIDRVVFSGVDDTGATVFPTVTPGAHYAISGANNNIVTGTASVGYAATPVAYSGLISQITFVYSNVTTGANIGNQWVWLSDISWVDRSVDVAITKTDGSPSYTPGQTSTYTINVANNGPDNAVDLAVQDNLPAGLTMTGPWSCTASAGSSCSSAGGGSAGDTSASLTVDLLNGGSAQILVPVEYSADMSDY